MADLLVTYDSAHSTKAREELKELLESIGEKTVFRETGIEGDVIVEVSDAITVIEKIREAIKNNPEKFNYLARFVPITVWTETKIEKIQEAIKGLLDRIGEEEKWKMSLEKRGWNEMHSRDLIIKLTDVVDRKNVDLVNPDKIIQVEILGEKTGVSILSPQQLFDARKQ